MKLGQVFQSISSWNKLSNIGMKPRIAYAILRYARLVSAEFDIAEKQRISLIHTITETKDGEVAEIKTGTPEFAEYAEKFSEILEVESNLEKLYLNFSEVVEASDDANGSLTVNDLAVLEPFFS